MKFMECLRWLTWLDWMDHGLWCVIGALFGSDLAYSRYALHLVDLWPLFRGRGREAGQRSVSRVSDQQCHLPGLNRESALRQANSPGSTASALNRARISLSTRKSANRSFESPGILSFADGFTNILLDSSGRHHWIAHSRNSSAQDSSNSIT